MAADILSRQLVDITADLGDPVQPVAFDSEPFAFNRDWDAITILGIGIQDASLVHRLTALGLQLEGEGVVTPGAEARLFRLQWLEDRARHCRAVRSPAIH